MKTPRPRLAATGLLRAGFGEVILAEDRRQQQQLGKLMLKTDMVQAEQEAKQEENAASEIYFRGLAWFRAFL